MKLTAFTADFQSSQNYLLEFLLLDTADLLLQSSYRLSCLTVKNHVVEKTGQRFNCTKVDIPSATKTQTNLILLLLLGRAGGFGSQPFNLQPEKIF